MTERIERAVARAKKAAGKKDVTIIGAASTAHQVIAAGLADELHIDVMPVLLGRGLRLFDETEPEPVQRDRLLPGKNPAASSS